MESKKKVVLFRCPSQVDEDKDPYEKVQGISFCDLGVVEIVTLL